MIKERDKSIDIAKGIAILLMIAGHGHLPTLADNFIYSFHMPLFFFCSGYFFRIQQAKSNWDIIKKLSVKLFPPFLYTAIATLILIPLWDPESFTNRVLGVFFPNGNRDDSILLTSVFGIGPIWFLLSLFWCRLFYLYIGRCKYPFIISVSLAFTSFLLGRYVLNLPFAIQPGICGLVFYSMGYYLRVYGIDNIGKPYFCALIGCWVFCICFSRLEMTCFTYEIWPLDQLAALGGILCTLKLSRIIDVNVTYSKLKRVLIWFGGNSLLVLCYHQICCHLVEVFKVYFISFNGKNIAMAMNIVLVLVLMKIHFFLKCKLVKLV